MRAAAAMTSITMKAGTSLRAEGAISRLAASNIVVRPLMPRGNSAPLSPYSTDNLGDQRPTTERDLAERDLAERDLANVILTALTVLGRTTRLRGKMGPSQADMTGTETPIRARRTALATRAIAVVTASALAGASLPARAQGGPPVVRDAEIEQLLKEYTQPLLRTAGLAQQNIAWPPRACRLPSPDSTDFQEATEGAGHEADDALDFGPVSFSTTRPRTSDSRQCRSDTKT
jgi:hypothetical protein